jgi:signal transduction histidine kinase
LASILHDLKTPLNCISGTSQILRAFVETDQPILMPYIKNFDLSLEFIFSMIEDIQDLAKFSGA